MKGFKIIKEILKRLKSAIFKKNGNIITISEEMGEPNCYIDNDGRVWVPETEVEAKMNNAYACLICVPDGRGNLTQRVVVKEVD